VILHTDSRNVVGLTTAETPQSTVPSNVAGLAFDDPVVAARHIVPMLERECDLVVALTHIGLDEDRRLARDVPGVDVVVGGHTHLALQTPERVGATPIVQAGDNGRFLGRLDLTIVDGKVTDSHGELIPIVDGMPEDVAVSRLVEGFAGRVRDRLATVVGTSTALLDGDRTRARSGETTLGNFVADLMRTATRADVALVNGGSLRASIGAGSVTYGDVITALPFENPVVVVALRGRTLRAALDRSAALAPASQPGGFLQVSGLRYAIENGRAVDVTVAGAPLDDEREYTVAISDFLLAGGDGYTTFASEGTQRPPTGLVVQTLVLDAFRSGAEVSPRLDGRIVRRGKGQSTP